MTYVPPKYPGEIPTENDLFPWIDDKHYVSVEKFTAIVKELRAALIELGVDPAGAHDTVAAFLTALNTNKITGAQVPENETDPSVDDSLKGITLAQVRDHPLSRARGYRDALGQSISTGTLTKILLNAENYDTLGEFDPVTNHRFTAQVAGYYLVVGQIKYLTPVADKFYQARIHKNGTRIAFCQIHASSTSNTVISTQDIIYLAAGEYIELFAYHNSTNTEVVDKGSENTFLAVHRLS